MPKQKLTMQKRKKTIYSWAVLLIPDPKVIGRDTLLLVQGQADIKREEYIFPDRDDNMYFCREHLDDVKRQCQKDWGDIGTYSIQEVGTFIVFREKGFDWEAENILGNLADFWKEAS